VIRTGRHREKTAIPVIRSAPGRNTMFPTKTETAYGGDNDNMTDPEASDDPGDIEFDGSTRRVSGMLILANALAIDLLFAVNSVFLPCRV
jgi:hypothetical protein